MTTHQDIPAADCRCGTRESPVLDLTCPIHGARTGRAGSYDDWQAGAVLVTCACGRQVYATVPRPHFVCADCVRAAQASR